MMMMIVTLNLITNDFPMIHSKSFNIYVVYHYYDIIVDSDVPKL